MLGDQNLISFINYGEKLKMEYEIENVKHIKDLYVIENLEVFLFLKDNKDLIPILLEIPEHVKEYFGDRKIILDILHFLSEKSNELFIGIDCSNITQGESLKLIRELLFNWWTDKSKEIND